MLRTGEFLRTVRLVVHVMILRPGVLLFYQGYLGVIVAHTRPEKLPHHYIQNLNFELFFANFARMLPFFLLIVQIANLTSHTLM